MEVPLLVDKGLVMSEVVMPVDKDQATSLEEPLVVKDLQMLAVETLVAKDPAISLAEILVV